jgi:hypothetical protein
MQHLASSIGPEWRRSKSDNGFGDALAVFFGQASGLGEKLLGVLLQGADPKLFGTLKILIEVGAVALEAFGEA